MVKMNAKFMEQNHTTYSRTELKLQNVNYDKAGCTNAREKNMSISANLTFSVDGWTSPQRTPHKTLDIVKKPTSPHSTGFDIATMQDSENSSRGDGKECRFNEWGT